jgi:hypothetical protein
MIEIHQLLARKRVLAAALGVLVAVVGGVAVWTAPASGSSAPIVISFEKHWVGPGHYVGTTSNGGSVDMQVSNPSVTGSMQHFDVTIRVTAPGQSFTAVLDGTFNFSTAKTLLNGTVTDGWLEGAQVHEAGQLADASTLTFTGTLRLMPASA